MRPISYTRTTVGILVLIGLLYYRPLAWFCGVMLVFAGVTGVCFVDMFWRRVLGRRKPAEDTDEGEVKEIGGGCV